MTPHILLLCIGFVALIAGAHWLVNTASQLAARMGVSPLVVGLTVVALGTSLPELVVNLVASVGGDSGLVVGNVLGSNIINTLVIVGVAALLRPIRVGSPMARREIPFGLLVTMVLLLLANDRLLFGAPQSMLSRPEGLILLVLFALFIYYSLWTALLGRGKPHETAPMHGVTVSVGIMLAGMVGLFVGGTLIVGSATALATALGVPQQLVGVTVVALGTSLPELATSALAAHRGESEIAFGNVIGSNIFNILLVFGLASVIRPIPFHPAYGSSLLMVGLSAFLLLALALLAPRNRIGRLQGGALLTIYAAYTAHILMRP